ADGTNFPLLAARGGVVSRVSRSCPNNDHSCVNYLVLEDSSTSPPPISSTCIWPITASPPI
ncbi:MAG TPA: hypothetical protein PLA25_10645, partial [Anaerolineaceae bacterium]|nr:hypothetical protein [Anaerolineaceae bacterium]